MDDLKNQMEGVTRTYTEFDNKMADKGGAQNLFGMNRKIRQALESITIGELDSMLGEIHRALVDGLNLLKKRRGLQGCGQGLPIVCVRAPRQQYEAPYLPHEPHG